MITINALNFIEIILDYSFLDLVITNSSFFYHFETCYCYTIFYTSNTVFLSHFICRLAALLKG